MTAETAQFTDSEWLDRNRGLVAPAQQSALRRATVLIAGVGGVGGRGAEVLARMGVGCLKLADPDHFSATNLNRQAGCTADTLGRNKAETIREVCRSVAPGIEVVAEPEGVTARNVADLLDGVDVVVDGTDYLRPDLGVLIAQHARRRGIPVVLAVEVGYGVWSTTFLPHTRTFEAVFGYPVGCRPDDVTAAPLWRWIVSVPRYVRPADLRRLGRGEIEAPAIAPAVELSAAVVATTVCRLIWELKPAAIAPRLHRLDLATGESHVVRHSRIRYAASVLRVLTSGDSARP